MIDKINTDQIRDMADQPAGRPPEAAKLPSGNLIDASLHVDYASLVDKAMQIPETHPGAVEEAKLLILSGKLDTLDSARDAARSILEFGL